MTITVNGQPRDVGDGTSLLALIEGLGLKPQLMVAQRNGDIVERSQFAETALEPDDVLELVHIVGGG